MQYTELNLAQLDRRILAGERCVTRQRELLNQHLAASLPTESVLQSLAEFEVRLSDLRSAREQVRAQIAAATTQDLITAFWSLSKQRRRPLATS